MANAFMDIYNDVIFKRVLGRRANKSVLISIINEIVDDFTVADLEYLSPEVTGFSRENKNSRMDLRVHTDTGFEMIIEMQVRDQKDFQDRAVYYAALPILEEVESGDGRYVLTPRMVISFLHFALRHDDDPHWDDEYLSHYSLREKTTHEKLSEAMNLVFIELGRFNKKLEELENDKERFYFCMKHMSEFDSMPREFEGNTVIEELFRTTAVESLSKKEKTEYIRFMTTERDIRNQNAFAIEQAEARGEARGREEGIALGEARGEARGREEGIALGEAKGIALERKAAEERMRQTALKLKSLGLSAEAIADATGFSVKEISNL